MSFQETLQSAVQEGRANLALELFVQCEQREFIRSLYALRDPNQNADRAIGQLMATVDRMKELNSVCEKEEVTPPFPMIMSCEKFVKVMEGS